MAADRLYPRAAQGLMDGSIDLDTATLKCCLIDAAGYVYSDSHQFLSDVPATARVGTPQTLTGKTVTDGVFDAQDVTLPTVSGDQSEAVLIWQSSAAAGGADVAEGAQRLIAYIDSYSGLPCTPNGTNIPIIWPNTANRIFKIGA